MLNTHLGCHTGAEQYAQTLELIPFIESLNAEKTAYGLVIAMDANSLSYWSAIKHLKKHLIDAHTVKGRNPGYWKSGTFPSKGVPLYPSNNFLLQGIGPAVKLDYIFSSRRGGEGWWCSRLLFHLVNGSQPAATTGHR